MPVTTQKVQGYKGQLQYQAAGSPALILGIKDIEIEIKSDKLDTTDHSTNGWKSSMNGLTEWTGTAKLDYITGDASQIAIRNAIINSTPMPLTFLPLQGAGYDEYSGTAIITSFKTGAKNAELEGIDITFDGQGALTVGAQTT